MVTLAVTNPDHLQRLGLFPGNKTDDEGTISKIQILLLKDLWFTVIIEIHMNFLMKVALEKLAFLPYSYIVDLVCWINL